jgi:hypothetical protein
MKVDHKVQYHRKAVIDVRCTECGDTQTLSLDVNSDKCAAELARFWLGLHRCNMDAAGLDAVVLPSYARSWRDA